MSKGQQTRSAILDAAVSEAATIGVGALSIGALASRTGLSKSGLFGHFGSKENLQMAVMERLVERFVIHVVQPAFKNKNGVKRLTALFKNYIAWVDDESLARGCPILSISLELIAQPGPLRDYVTKQVMERADMIRRVAQKCVREGDFKEDLDIERFVFEYEGLATAYISYRQVFGHPQATELAQETFDQLVRNSMK